MAEQIKKTMTQKQLLAALAEFKFGPVKVRGGRPSTAFENKKRYSRKTRRVGKYFDLQAY